MCTFWQGAQHSQSVALLASVSVFSYPLLHHSQEDTADAGIELLKVLAFNPGVGQNIAMHVSPTARNSVFFSFFLFFTHFILLLLLLLLNRKVT